jgi:beta-lactamase regulating signal transducer with metallopeptidase domain
MLHALSISIVESAVALGLAAFVVSALRLSARWRFLMWATVLLIALAGLSASFVASRRPAVPPAITLTPNPPETVAIRRQGVPGRPFVGSSRAANKALELIARGGETLWAWAEAVWLLGALIGTARTLISLGSIARLRRDAMSAASRSSHSTASKLLTDLPSGMTILELESVASPVFVGFGPPLILLPKRLLTDLGPDDASFILAHELEHWRRRDDYADLASRFVAAVLWPNPSVHLARRLMLIDRECACDHAASRALDGRVKAANSLWRSAQILGLTPSAIAVAALGSSPQLVTRIQRLMSPRPSKELNGRILVAAVGPLVALAIFVAAIASPGTAQAPATDRSEQNNHPLLNKRAPQNGGTAVNDAQWAARKSESGETARLEKRLHDARADFAAAAAWYAAHGPVQMKVHTLSRQAQIERDLANYEAAASFQREALRLQREIGPDGLPHAIRHLADILDDGGRHEEASPYYAEMETLYRNSSTPPLEMANAVRSLAVHAEHVGDKDRAHRLWLEARDRYAKLDDVFLKLTGERRNPGVEEAERRLAVL